MRYLFSLLVLLILSGCAPKQEALENFFQTNSATLIKNDYQKISKLLITLKDKLDKRNPNAYDKDLANQIYYEIDILKDNIDLKYENKELKDYKEYLELAFLSKNIKNRNDYLILGMYKHIYDAYRISDGHRVTAFSYEKERLQRLYYNLQLIKWKIKTKRDEKGDYLFLTWQNNWQVELEKKVRSGFKPNWEDINNLKYIKNKEESIFTHSNFSFEIILTQMLERVSNSLKLLGVDPTQLSLDAIKTVFLFL